MSIAASVSVVKFPCSFSSYFQSVLTTICALCPIGIRVDMRNRITPAVGLCSSRTNRSKSLSEVISNALCLNAISSMS